MLLIIYCLFNFAVGLGSIVKEKKQNLLLKQLNRSFKLQVSLT